MSSPGPIVTSNHLEFDVNLYLVNSAIRDDGGKTPLIYVSPPDKSSRIRIEFGATLGGTLRIYMTPDQAADLHKQLAAVLVEKARLDQEAFGG